MERIKVLPPRTDVSSGNTRPTPKIYDKETNKKTNRGTG